MAQTHDQKIFIGPSGVEIVVVDIVVVVVGVERSAEEDVSIDHQPRPSLFVLPPHVVVLIYFSSHSLVAMKKK